MTTTFAIPTGSYRLPGWGRVTVYRVTDDTVYWSRAGTRGSMSVDRFVQLVEGGPA